MKPALHILHLEDDPNDAALIQSILETGGITCAITRVETHDEFVAALERGGLDLILSDFLLPAFDGLAALKIAQARWPDIPFIVASGTLGEERAVDSLKSGATDYVLKGHLVRLVPAVRRAMQEVEDRAEHRRIERLIQSERNFSETSLNSLPGIFYLYDQAGKFLRWNRNFERVSGYAAEELARMGPLDFFVGDERDYIAKKIEEVFAAGAANAEARFAARDGTLTDYYFTGQKVQMEGRPCLIGTGIDVSERKKLELQFIGAQKMEVMGQLASGVAHDFNNILAVMMGYGNLILAELGADSPLRKYAEEIQHAADRAAGLTRQLLVFSRKQTIQPVVLDLNDVLKDLDKMLHRLIDEHITLTMVPGKEIGRIKADPGYVGQVLMNLVVNARDAMPNGGKLTIATDNVTLDARSHKGAIPGAYVRLTVSDTGTGMTDEVKARLFEAFFTTKPKGKGTGLGLATVFGIVQQHKGWISVESEVSRGSTFRVYLPRLTKAPDEASKWSSLASLRVGHETILLVEDDDAVRLSVKGALSSLGYRVLEATSGIEALKVWKLNRDEIRLLMTDLMMPGGMTGKELAKLLLHHDPKLKTIYTSGYSKEIAGKEFPLEEGINFLTKPFEASKLAQAVRKCLDAVGPKL